MNRLVRGSVILAAAAVSWACGGLDTDGIEDTAQLVADPGVVYVANTDSQAVFVEALNDIGQQLEGDFTVTDVGPGINVNYDTTFAPRPGVDNLPTRVRYFVRATNIGSFANTTFTVSANGKSVTIPVRITLASINSDFSNPTPNVGDTVTLTAPAGVLFTPGTRVNFPSGTANVISVSPDSTSLQVVFSASPSGFPLTPTVDSVVISYLGAQRFNNIPTTGTITTPSLESFLVGISTLNATVGQAVTLTIPAPYKATPTSVILTPGAANVINSISADSSTVIFQAGPNANGVVSINNLRISGNAVLGAFSLAIDSAGAFTTPVFTQFTSVVNDLTPDVNQSVTLSAAGFKFLPSTVVYFGNDVQTVTAISADSNTVTFRAHKPGASGTVSVSGIVFNNLTAIGLTLNATDVLTVSNTQLTLPGTNAFATAPLIQIPAAGKTGGVIDPGAYPAGPGQCLGYACKIYKIVLTGARTFSLSVTWNSVADVGVYRYSSAFAGPTNIGCDIHGPAPGQFETCTLTALAAGTYYLVALDFSVDYTPPDDVPPTSLVIDITGN